MDRRRSQVGDGQVTRDVSNARGAADGSLLASVGLSDGEIEAVAVDQRGDDSPINDFLGTAAVVRLRLPGRNRLVAIPIAFDLQPFFIIGTAAMTMADGALILKCFFGHSRMLANRRGRPPCLSSRWATTGGCPYGFYFALSSLRDAELMQ